MKSTQISDYIFIDATSGEIAILKPGGAAPGEERCREMSIPLDELIERARHYVMTPEEREESIRSFAYGNVRLHNPNVTRSDIDQAADRLRGEMEGGEK